MKRVYSFLMSLVICSLTYGQQIAEIIEYTPAPGQFINTESGNPEAAASLLNERGGLVSLGGFGGKIVFRLGTPIENDPDNPYGVDFTVFGNSLPHWSEPGIVCVMKDYNNNGIPDDNWYELAGSDHFFPGTTREYSITYNNPGSDHAMDIPWGDNQGATGLLYKTSFQHQSYYPDPEVFSAIGEEQCEFSGTRINPVLDFSNPAQTISYSRHFGYADNNSRIDPSNALPDNPYVHGSENSGGDGMDISWAINETGEYIDLDQVDFIKVYSAVNANGGILGEISTEITLLVDVDPQKGYPVPEKTIAIKGLPAKIQQDAYELESAVFINGRYAAEETVSWSIEATYSKIDSEFYLLAEGEEQITLTATLDSDPTVTRSFSTEVIRPAGHEHTWVSKISIYPNPCTDHLMINTPGIGCVMLVDSRGILRYKQDLAAGASRIDLDAFHPGLYLVLFRNSTGLESYHKIIKR